MTDPRVENLAKTLVHYSVGVKPGDWVLIQANLVAMPLANEVQRYVLRAGGLPNLVAASDETNEIFYKEAGEEQLRWVSPFEQIAIEQADVMISLMAAENTRSQSGVDPKKAQIHSASHVGLFQTHMKRSAEGSLRWTLSQFPCQAFAQEADMSLSEYEDFVYAATFADQPDPIARWQAMHEEQQRLVDWLAGKKQVVVRGPNADLTLSIDGRTFINSDGKHNMPSGEIFTGPVEESANGWIRFTYPALTHGREVEGVELKFKDGKIIDARAEKNQDFLTSMLDSDPGARYLGEFAFGANYGIKRFTKSILFDEKIGGSIHLAAGNGYPETGSKNHSSIHWDFICDMRDESEVLVDGELFYKNGQFVI